jgi:hypothetical protein
LPRLRFAILNLNSLILQRISLVVVSWHEPYLDVDAVRYTSDLNLHPLCDIFFQILVNFIFLVQIWLKKMRILFPLSFLPGLASITAALSSVTIKGSKLFHEDGTQFHVKGMYTVRFNRSGISGTSHAFS